MTVYDIPDFSSSNILLVSSENDVADVHQPVARFGGREPQHGVHGPLKKNENKTRKKKTQDRKQNKTSNIHTNGQTRKEASRGRGGNESTGENDKEGSVISASRGDVFPMIQVRTWYCNVFGSGCQQVAQHETVEFKEIDDANRFFADSPLPYTRQHAW